MEEIASVYARSLFEVAQEQDKLDKVREELGEFADALNESRELQVQPMQTTGLPQMIRVLNNARKNNRLYVRLVTRDDGAVVKGEPLVSVAGRVDDFAWPPSQRQTQALLAPPVEVAPPGDVPDEGEAVEAGAEPAEAN